jgi:hypothetical protein
MSTIKISQFGGMIPAVDDTVLPDSNASFAQNAFLYSGGVQGFNVTQSVRALTSPSTATVYRLPYGYYDAEHIGDAYWMEFATEYTDVIRTAVVNDSFERYYWASPTDVPRYNTKARILAGSPAYKLGVPAPTALSVTATDVYVSPLGSAALTASSSAKAGAAAFSNATHIASSVASSSGFSTGSLVPDGIVEGLMSTRSYVVTWVSAYGEEGPPCDPITLSGHIDGRWDLSGLVPPTYTDRNITKLRVYRTVTSSQGVATYFQVDEIDATSTTYRDTKLDTVIVANNQLQSLTWFPPPDDLQGWVSMPNGMVAGWRGKEIWFCEQYRPHAWPPEYTVATEYEIVGLGVVGQSLIVCTRGFPTAITGINPASMSMAKMSVFEPCQSRGSIVSAPEGVYYASPNGLILASAGQFINVTKNSITKDKWQSLVKVASLRAVHFGSGYLAFGSVQFGCFDGTAFNPNVFEQDDYSGAYSGILIDPTNSNATTTLYSPTPYSNLQIDPWSGETLIIADGKVNWLDMQSLNKDKAPYIWRSKVFQSAKPENFEAIKIYFTVASGVTRTPTGAIDTSLTQTLTSNKLAILRVYADYKLISAIELRNSGDQLRLPSGFKALYWQIEVEGVVNINSVQMATSARELRDV